MKQIILSYGPHQKSDILVPYMFIIWLDHILCITQLPR